MLKYDGNIYNDVLNISIPMYKKDMIYLSNVLNTVEVIRGSDGVLNENFT